MTAAPLPFFATVNGTDYTDRTEYTAACKREGYRYINRGGLYGTATKPLTTRQVRYFPELGRGVHPRDYSPRTKQWAAAKEKFGGALWCISAKTTTSARRDGSFYVWVVEDGKLVEYLMFSGAK